MIVTIDADNKTATVMQNTPATVDGVAEALEQIVKDNAGNKRTGKASIDMPYQADDIAVIVYEVGK